MKKIMNLKYAIIGVISILFVSCKGDESPPITIEAFDLISTTDNAVSVDLHPNLNWEDAISSDKNAKITYTIYLGTDKDPETIIADNLTDSNFTITERLETYSTYYWKVVAKSGSVTVPSESIFKFSTRGIDFNPTAPLSDGSASFPRRSGHTSVVFNNKLWVIGGYDSMTSSASNEVWYSENNGATWSRQPQVNGGFSARTDHTTVVFNNKLWVIGGFSSNVDTNDVWSSTDGSNWNKLPKTNPFPVRSGHTTLVFDNKLWVIGGRFTGFFKNDVWNSTDGVNWTKVTDSAPFPERFDHSSVVFDGKLWVIGGSDGQTKNDVWFSSDGSSWAQATPSANFTSRLSHTSVVFDNKIWVIGGANGNYKNDVWYSADGETWMQATASSAFSARLSHSSLVLNDEEKGTKSLCVIGGRDQSAAIYKNDVWAFE